MRTMTIAAMKKMVGTEFIYVYSDRDEIRAFIAAFDEKVGYTCLALETETKYGNDLSGDLDENGNLCLVADNPSRPGFIKGTSIDMCCIKALGYLKAGIEYGFGRRM